MGTVMVRLCRMDLSVCRPKLQAMAKSCVLLGRARTRCNVRQEQEQERRVMRKWNQVSFSLKVSDLKITIRNSMVV